MSKRRNPNFRRRAKTRARVLSWWTLWRVPALLAVVSAAWWFVYRPYFEDRGWTRVTDSFALCGEPWSGASGCVVDGDTVVIGNGSARRRIRLIGFDAPELDGACPAEQQLARDARVALHSWLADGTFEWSGNAEAPRDQYGRELREVHRLRPGDGYEYLAETMIERDLAGASSWGGSDVDWCR